MRIPATLALVALTLLAPPASAWERHSALMPAMIAGVDPQLRQTLGSSIQPVCGDADARAVAQLMQVAKFNPRAQLGPTSPNECTTGQGLTIERLLSGPAIDDPDRGGDQDLDASLDPKGDREWMGGTSGMASDGFRHDYFGGWNPLDPVTTIQYPFRPLGQGPARVAELARVAKTLLQGGQAVPGLRALAWALHYLQDLAEPYHAAQVPWVRLVPWFVLLHDGWQELRSETTRIHLNFQRAYEAYVLSRLDEGPQGTFADCLVKPETAAKFSYASAVVDPLELARALAASSVSLAEPLARAEDAFIGASLRPRDVDFTRLKNSSLDYAELAIRPDLTEARQDLHTQTCAALANATIATRRLIAWAVGR